LGSLAAVAAAAFHAADPAAALLLLPFVGWTCFATALVNCALASGNAEVLATLMFAPAVVICTGLLSSAQRPSAAHWHAPASANAEALLAACAYRPVAQGFDDARRMFPLKTLCRRCSKECQCGNGGAIGGA